MKSQDSNTRNFIYSMILLIALNNSGCLKRITVPPTSQELRKSHENIIYVRLKSEEKGRPLMLRNPKIEGEYLIGEIDHKQTKISLDDIESIEVVKIDKKKVIIISSIILIVSVFSILYGYGYYGYTED